MKYSSLQVAIFDHVEKGTGNGAVDAVAGSGKTTTIVEAFKRAQGLPGVRKALFLAFNRSIVGELKERGVQAKTLNGLGYGALMKGLDYEPRLNADKVREITDAVIEWDLIKRYGGSIGRLVGLAKGLGIVPNDRRLSDKFRGLTPDSEEVWFDVLNRYDFDLGDNPDATEEELIELARMVLVQSLLDTGQIDFDDQKYLPVIMGLRPYLQDYIFLDECQDLNLVDRALVRSALSRTGRLLAVGDPHQAIYGWRGADVDSFQRIVDEFQCEQFPLSVCYRCPTSVIELAQTWVPHIQAAPGKPEGKVEYLGGYDHTLFKPRDWVICRNNAPLISLAYKLMAKKVPVTVMGRDFGQQIMKLVRRLGDNIPAGEGFEAELLIRVDGYRKREVDKAMARKMESKAARINDMCDSIVVIIESSDIECISDVEGEMLKMFSDDAQRNAVILSSIHKAKGGQAPTVYILDWWLLPSRYATSPEAIQQEHNLQYVAVTRAQERLRFINIDLFDKGQQPKPKARDAEEVLASVGLHKIDGSHANG